MASSSNPVVAEDGKEALILPFGYRFHPSDDQVIHYLKQKIFDEELPADIIPTISDLYQLSPDEIPLGKFRYPLEYQSELCLERQWFFFSTRFGGNLRLGGNPSTGDGYWHSTEATTEVDDSQGIIIGFKRPIDFYKGIFPDGIKSNWAIYEYRLNPDVQDAAKVNDNTKDKLQNFVACRVIGREEREIM